MSIKKSVEANPYQDTVVNPDDGNMLEYRPNVSFAVSKVYSVSNRPAAAVGNASLIIWVVDALSGEQLQYSDGTSWIPIKY